jgi:hypothetical protein
MTMNAATWKQILRWLLTALASLVILDWILDGRLRRHLPGRQPQRESDETH